jgi:hypothetical protein
MNPLLHTLLPIHVAAGGLAMVLGAAALGARKGGTLHRRSGLLFVYVMLVLGASASILGFLKNGPGDGNVFAGIMTAYFVGTALTTIRPVSSWTGSINVAAGVALGVTAMFSVILSACGLWSLRRDRWR